MQRNAYRRFGTALQGVADQVPHQVDDQEPVGGDSVILTGQLHIRMDRQGFLRHLLQGKAFCFQLRAVHLGQFHQVGVHVGQAPGFFDDQVAHLMPHPVIGSILLDQPGCADHGGQGCAHFMGQSIDQLLALAGLYPQGFLPLLYGFVHGDEPVGEPGDLVPFRGRFQRKSISAADRVRGAGKDPEPPGDPAGDQQGQDGGQHKPAHAEQDAVSGLLPAHGIETGIIRYGDQGGPAIQRMDHIQGFVRGGQVGGAGLGIQQENGPLCQGAGQGSSIQEDQDFQLGRTELPGDPLGSFHNHVIRVVPAAGGAAFTLLDFHHHGPRNGGFLPQGAFPRIFNGQAETLVDLHVY